MSVRYKHRILEWAVDGATWHQREVDDAGRTRQGTPSTPGLQQGSQFLVPRQGTPNFLVSSASPRTRHPAAPKSPSVIPHRPGQTRSLVFVKTLTRFLTTGTSTAAMHTPANLANTVLVPRVRRPWHRAFQRTPRYRCCCCYSRRR